MFPGGEESVLLLSVKNCEGPEMLPTCKLRRKLATVTQMQAEDVRLLGQR